MKRTILLILLSVLLLTSCGYAPEPNSTDEAAIEMTKFDIIEGREYLVYNIDTKIVYYMFSTDKSIGHLGYGYSYFAPYISENGRFCRYVDGQIMEIDTNN